MRLHLVLPFQKQPASSQAYVQQYTPLSPSTRHAKNQTLLFQSLSQAPRHLIIPFQTHGTKILPVDEKFLGASGQQQQEMLNGIDALITTEPGCCICISTADCIPVLLYDRVHHAVAAVHAGWRGTVEYIVGHTLEKMRAVFGTEGQDVIECPTKYVRTLCPIFALKRNPHAGYKYKYPLFQFVLPVLFLQGLLYMLK